MPEKCSYVSLQKEVTLTKQLFIYVLLLSFVMQMFVRVAIVVDYSTNKSLYLQYCENKSRPELHCNGQCILMKKLKKQEEKESKQVSQKLESAAFFHEVEKIEFHKPRFHLIPDINLSGLICNYSFQFVVFIFRPPLISI
ncbi:hypothetical protein I6J02_20780 [Sphingobacterium spiritivorum]|nr:hypothetical protein I6J02_20780 [Sphingobacterium spiritivorum]